MAALEVGWSGFTRRDQRRPGAGSDRLDPAGSPRVPPHLPNGTDGFTGHAVVNGAAEALGGVVLPWSYLTMGTLALSWSFRYDPTLVAEALRQTLRQLPVQGVRLAVVHTGHGPLDLNHLVKRVCAEVDSDGGARSDRSVRRSDTASLPAPHG